MVRMGLVLADNYTAVAFAEKNRIVKYYSSAPASGDTFQRVDSALSQVEDHTRKFGKKISSIAFVTDAVRTALLTLTNLDKVALLRLSSPEGSDSPALLERAFAERVLAGSFVISGGHGFDGRLINMPNREEIRTCYTKMKNSVSAFVVASPFSILFPDHEKMGVAELSELGAEKIWGSIDVSQETSMLDRETTAVLSAATSGIIERVGSYVLSKLNSLGCRPRVYFGRNDGTIIGSALAQRFPLETAWSVEGHSIAGASKFARQPVCLVAGVNGSEVWVGGANNGKPIMRKISYLNEMLLHVSSPVLSRYPQSAAPDVLKTRFQLMSSFVGATKVLAADPTQFDAPFSVARESKSPAYAAMNAATASIMWKWNCNVPKGIDVKRAENDLNATMRNQMRQAGAKTFTFDHLTVRAGINLPEGSKTLSLQARGLPF